ncbi:cell division protein DamX [Pseudescherichia vulneris]
MDEFKPEDDLKPDPSDRRAGRSRQSSDRENDQQINFDDVDLDADERRPARTRKARDEREERAERLEEEEYYDPEEDAEAEEQVERRPRKRKKMPASKPASRQYIMMGVGILVLLLLIVGIGSALKAPSTSNEQASSDAKSIDLAANGGTSADQANGAQPAPGAAPANQTATNPQQDVSLPPISSTPTQGQDTAAPQGQQRVEVQGDLNNALTQQQGQLDGAVANSTLPTEPATVAPVRNGSAPRQATSTAATTAPAATTRPERKHAVIEPKPQSKPQTTAKATAPKPVAQQPKRTETAATSTPAKTTVPATEPAKPAATKPAATTAAPTATATAPAATTAGKASGDVASLKGAPGNHYTLQLSSSSNYDNLNNWARKENIQKYVVYQTTRNGQPWYVLVSGTYATKDEAKRAVAALPADVQAKNPWAKPLHQVQSDLKQ